MKLREQKGEQSQPTRTWRMQVRDPQARTGDLREPSRETGESTSVADVYIYDLIGMWLGVSSREFMLDIMALGDVAQVNLYIHSDGGDLFTSLAMYEFIKRHPAQFHGYVDGLVASAGTIALAACDKIIQPTTSWQMIHEVWTYVEGTADELEREANRIRESTRGAAQVYAERQAGGKAISDKDIDAILVLMKAETWMLGERAIELGFADEISGAVSMNAILPDQLRRYKNVPPILMEKTMDTNTKKLESPQAEKPDTNALMAQLTQERAARMQAEEQVSKTMAQNAKLKEQSDKLAQEKVVAEDLAAKAEVTRLLSFHDEAGAHVAKITKAEFEPMLKFRKSDPALFAECIAARPAFDMGTTPSNWGNDEAPEARSASPKKAKESHAKMYNTICAQKRSELGRALTKEEIATAHAEALRRVPLPS